MTTQTRKRSSRVLLGVTALMASTLSGCSLEGDPDYVAICADPQGNTRVADDQCDEGEKPVDYVPTNQNTGSSGSEFFWFYMLTSSSL